MTQPTIYTGGRLAPSVQGSQPQDNAIRTGRVITVTGTTAVIDVVGGNPITGILSSYVPVVGDNVVLLRNSATWLVLGRVNDAATAGPPYSGQQLIAAVQARGTPATTPPGTGTVDVTGATLTFSPPFGNVSWMAWAVFDFSHIIATQATVLGTLVVDGVTQTGQAVFNSAAINERGCVAQHWQGSGLSAADHTFKLQMQALTTGTYTANADNTNLLVQFYR